MIQQVALISGCSGNLGRLAVEALGAHGFVVYAGLRNISTHEELTSYWQSRYPNVHPISLDVTRDVDCQAATGHIMAAHGRLDILINNAALSLAGPTDQFTTQQFLDLLNVNLVGAFRLTREAVRVMKQQRSGRIINITSLNGLVALPNFGLYSASKFGLEALGSALRIELRSSNIWLTNIAPGAIRSDEVSSPRSLPHTPAREKFRLLRVALPMISTTDVVHAILKVVHSPAPPANLTLGRDARLAILLQRYLPNPIWNALIQRLWDWDR